jgi:ATP-dependent exoDNAse (exonuclease V) alpha subunit
MTLKVVAPTTLDGIEKYLGSEMVKGIGPYFAKKLVKAFGELVFDVIEQTPERLLELPGIGKKRQQRVTNAWSEKKVTVSTKANYPSQIADGTTRFYMELPHLHYRSRLRIIDDIRPQ